MKISVQENKTNAFFWVFEIQKDHPISNGRSHLVFVNQNKISCALVGFACQADHRVDKYSDFSSKLKKLKLTLIPNVVGALWTVTKDLEKVIDEPEEESKPFRTHHFKNQLGY